MNAERRKGKDFERVCKMVHAGHGARSPTPADTLNRLFQKHLRGHQPDLAADPPSLSSDNVVVSVEVWPKEKLWKLAERENSRLPHPLYMHLPVVIVRYRARDCMIDGGSRVNTWHNAGDDGTHPAFVLTVL